MPGVALKGKKLKERFGGSGQGHGVRQGCKQGVSSSPQAPPEARKFWVLDVIFAIFVENFGFWT
jgi:hypothetical protein